LTFLLNFAIFGAMERLTLDNLLPLAEFTGQRREFLAAHHRYLDRYRRVRIGPTLTLVFENRQTLWFRVQDVLRIARLQEPRRVQQELDVYNRLLPHRDRLQAALLIDIADESRMAEETAFWARMPNDALRLRIGEHEYVAQLLTCRPEDRCNGTAHWVQLPIPADERAQLVNFGQSARFEVRHDTYRHESSVLSEDVRQSLFEDLQMSDKDGTGRLAAGA
jgi:hypothetical protein